MIASLFKSSPYLFMRAQTIILPLICAVSAQTFENVGDTCEQTALDGTKTIVSDDLCCTAANENWEESLLDLC